MSDQRRRVLDLLAQGKITVDEAEQLLRAIVAEPPADAVADKPKPRYFRINVHQPARNDHREKDVNIRVPVSIVRSGLRLGAIIPAFASDRVHARLRERGLDIDLSKVDAAAIESILADMGEVNIDMDDGKATVRITCE